MSRVNLLEQIITRDKKKSAFDFDYDNMTCIPIRALFTDADIKELINIATSLKFNADIQKKYDLIDQVMRRRGFIKAHAGTNRVVYNFLEDSSFIAKVAVDKVGMKDSPKEFINQQYFKPFCCKIFEVDSSGIIAFIERVNPISSIEEFLSVSDDIFNMMVSKIIGKYVVDDLGVKSFMNFGIRYNSNGTTFGPVIIDFPYVYELDGARLTCKQKLVNPLTGKTEICNGEIDYDDGFGKLKCTKCNHTYTAMDLSKRQDLVLFHYEDSNSQFINDIIHSYRARVIDHDKILLDSGLSSTKYLTYEECVSMINTQLPLGEFDVDDVEYIKRKPIARIRANHYSYLQRQYYESRMKAETALREKLKSEGVKLTSVDGIEKIKDRSYYSDYGMRRDYSEVYNPRHPLYEVEIDGFIDTHDNPVDVSSGVIHKLEESIMYQQQLNQYDETDIRKAVINLNNSEGLNANDRRDIETYDDSNSDPNYSMEAFVTEQLYDENDDPSTSALVEQPVTSSNSLVYVDEDQASTIESAISQENVDRLAEYIAHKDDEQEEINDEEYIIDPEQDQDLSINPMSRPYAKAQNQTISVNSKIEPNLSLLFEGQTDMPSLIDRNKSNNRLTSDDLFIDNSNTQHQQQSISDYNISN